MPVELRETTAYAAGDVGIENAEALDEWLANGTVDAVDVSEVTHLHGAVLQLLLHHRPPVFGVPKDRFTAQLLSGLSGAGSESRP